MELLLFDRDDDARPGRVAEGRFRDDVRRFVKSDNNTVMTFAYRCFGGPDLYAHEERGPEQSINFVACHDGFTLNDLVSFNDKHNEANGEGGRDGSDTNLSWNCGVEGPTDDIAVRAAPFTSTAGTTASAWRPENPPRNRISR